MFSKGPTRHITDCTMSMVKNLTQKTLGYNGVNIDQLERDSAGLNHTEKLIIYIMKLAFPNKVISI